MSDLAALITKTLGVATTAPTMSFNRISDKAPPRPAEQYEYVVHYYRTEYGTAIVQAESKDDAYHYDINIDWGDTGDEEVSSVEMNHTSIVNQDELDDWDERYGDHFDGDGDPMCTECREYNASTNPPLERSNKDDGYGWYCQVCLTQ